MRAKIAPVAFAINPEVPFNSAKNRTAITDKTMDTERPGSPANQVLPITPMVSNACCGNEILIERSLKAIEISRKASNTAIKTKMANKNGIYAIVEKIIASKPIPTNIEEMRLLPARLLIASFIECRSLILALSIRPREVHSLYA